MIRQLAHVCLGTRNLDAALAFYIDLLGFAVAHEFHNAANERYGAFIHCGERTFLELFNDRTSAKEGGLYRHLCFEVDDLTAIVKALDAAGYDTEVQRGRTDGVLLAMTRDPDGHAIEFQQYDAESMQFRFLQRDAEDI